MRIIVETRSTGPVEVELTEEAPQTREAFLEALPLTGRANRWGKEIYFAIPVDASPESWREVVEMGTVAYWPPGKALCIFFGPTPASMGEEIRAASPVNPLGEVVGNAEIFNSVKNGDEVKVYKST